MGDRFCAQCGVPLGRATEDEEPLRGFVVYASLIADRAYLPDYIRALLKPALEQRKIVLKLTRAKVLEEIEVPYRACVMNSVHYTLKPDDETITFHQVLMERDEELTDALRRRVLASWKTVSKSGWIKDENLWRWDREQVLQWAKNQMADIDRYKP